MQYLDKGGHKILMVDFNIKTTTKTVIVATTIAGVTTVVEIIRTVTEAATMEILMVYVEASCVTSAASQTISLVTAEHLKVL